MSETFSSEFKAAIAFYAFTAWEFIVKWAKWYWKRYARETLCFLCGFLLAIIVLRSGQTKQIAAMEQRLIEAQQTAETAKEPTPGQLWSAEQEGYGDICRVLAGVKQYDLSDEAKKAICDVIVNRVNADYDVFSNDNTISEVCQHEGQFEGFKKDGSFSQADFKLISEYMQSNAGRVLNSDKYFWIETHHGYIIAKDSFNGNGSQQKVE